MSQSDVFADIGAGEFLLDIQSDLLDGLNTRVVIPLLAMSKAPRAASRFNPIVEVAGRPVFVATQFLAAVPAGDLQNPVANLDHAREEILAAVDMLLTGY